jgi:hypothetical protein
LRSESISQEDFPVTQISAQMVKELRERSGAGMMECKKALVENNGDLDISIEWLRKNGLAKADKKADRVAAEGRGRPVRQQGRAGRSQQRDRLRRQGPELHRLYQ